MKILLTLAVHGAVAGPQSQDDLMADELALTGEPAATQMTSAWAIAWELLMDAVPDAMYLPLRTLPD